jgi:hypothetical protein
VSGRRYLLSLALFIALFAGPTLGFVWTIDPYGTSPLHFRIAGVNALKPKRFNIDRDIKPYEVLVRQPRTVFLGTSRIHQAFNPAVLDGTPYAPAYNAAVPGASIAENIAFLKQYARTDRRLKHVFFEVFLYAFIYNTADVPDRGLADSLMDLGKMSLAEKAIADALETLDYNSTSTVRPPSIARRGYAIDEQIYPADYQFVAQAFSQAALNATKKVGGRIMLRQSSLDALKEAQAFCDARGIKLTFVIAPSYPWDDYRLYSTGDWRAIRPLYEALADFPHVASFAQLNALSAEPVSDHMRYWFDPLHFSFALGAAMQRALAGLPTDMPDNFIRRIDRSSLDAALAEREAGLRAWVSAHHDFTTVFDEMRVAVDGDGKANGSLDIPHRDLVVDGVAHPIVDEYAGSVEGASRQANDMEISGWAVDMQNHLPAASIVASVGDRVVSKWLPSALRLDIEAGYGGRSIRPSNFILPIHGALESSPIRVFAIMKDGRAAQLVSTLPLVSGTMVIGRMATSQ